MGHYLFNYVNPRWTDVLFEFFFPAGVYTFSLTLIVMAIVSFFYLVSVAVFRLNSQEDQRSLLTIGKEIGFFFVCGILVPFLAYVYSFILLGKSRRYIQVIRRDLDSTQELKSWKLKFKHISLALWQLFLTLLFLAAIVMVVLEYFGGQSYNSIHMVFGCIGGLIWLIKKKPEGCPVFLTAFIFTKAQKKKILGLMVVFPLILGSIFISSAILKTHEAAPGSPTSSDPTELRIISYNIRYGSATEDNPADMWINRRGMFAEYLDSFSADIIGVQEALVDQINYLTSNLNAFNYVYTGFGRDDGVRGGELSAILFRTDRFLFLDGDTFWLSDTPAKPSRTWGNGHYRVCTWARLEDQETGAQFVVFNTHYDFSDYFQERASKLINQKVVELSGGLPTILMGDFNLHNTSHAFQFTENYGDKPLADAYRIYHGGTAPFDYTSAKFDANYVSKTSRIDFIFISEHVQVTSCTIPKDNYGDDQTYSDHYPVLMDCVI